MSAHVGVTVHGVKEGRNRWLTLHGGLWALQVLWGFFFAGSGFGKVLLYDGTLYAQAPRAVAWYAAVSQPLIVFVAAGRWKFRRITAAPLTTARVLGSLAVLGLLVLTTFVPTWYTMTHAQF
jgi:hypothetical protein